MAVNHSVKHKTVVIICGLIGAGKTTYATTHFKATTDFDFMPKYSTKADQIILTKNLLKYYDEVAHITSYPSEEEIQAFKEYRCRFILIDTSLDQAKTNILIRSRERDMNNLVNVLKANEDYQKRFEKSDIHWEIVKVFDKEYA